MRFGSTLTLPSQPALRRDLLPAETHKEVTWSYASWYRSPLQAHGATDCCFLVSNESLWLASWSLPKAIPVAEMGRANEITRTIRMCGITAQTMRCYLKRCIGKIVISLQIFSRFGMLQLQLQNILVGFAFRAHCCPCLLAPMHLLTGVILAFCQQSVPFYLAPFLWLLLFSLPSFSGWPCDAKLGMLFYNVLQNFSITLSLTFLLSEIKCSLVLMMMFIQ